MKILSIRQPWASLIVAGVKDVENRTWPMGYRGRVSPLPAWLSDELTVPIMSASAALSGLFILAANKTQSAIPRRQCLCGRPEHVYGAA